MINSGEYIRRALQIVLSSSLFEAPMLFQIKNKLYKTFFHMGERCQVHRDVMLLVPHGLKGGWLKIGSDVGINAHSELDYSGGLTIHDGVWISQRALIETHAHQIDSRAPLKSHAIIPTPLEIGPNVWIGAGAIILPGVGRIGEGAIVAAGAIVSAAVPDWTVVGGVPAKFIKMRE